MIEINISFFFHFVIILIGCKILKILFFDEFYDVICLYREKDNLLKSELQREMVSFELAEEIILKEKKIEFFEIKKIIESQITSCQEVERILKKQTIHLDFFDFEKKMSTIAGSVNQIVNKLLPEENTDI